MHTRFPRNGFSLFGERRLIGEATAGGNPEGGTGKRDNTDNKEVAELKEQVAKLAEQNKEQQKLIADLTKEVREKKNEKTEDAKITHGTRANIIRFSTNLYTALPIPMTGKT